MSRNKILLASAAQMREMDRMAIEDVGIQGLELMEAAGSHTARNMIDSGLEDGPVAILCGSGNNGGDGFVVARILKKEGFRPEVFLLADPERLTGDARTNFERLPEDIPVVRVNEDTLESVKERFQAAETIVDGLLGTGLQREVSGLYAEVIRAANRTEANRVALDIPSGLSSDTGRRLGTAFQAHQTYTYGLAKIGQVLHPAVEYGGRLRVVDIGIPEGVVKMVGVSGELLTEGRARDAVTLRDPDSHKGNFGHVMLLAGSPGKSGAALLAAHGALRSGVGLVTTCTDPETRAALAANRPESMSLSLSGDVREDFSLLTAQADRSTSLAIGPGWGIDESRRELLERLLDAYPEKPVLLDADALTLLASSGPEILQKRAENGGITVLTPHPGEAGRLLRMGAGEIQADRPAAAKALASLTASHVVLKGARSLICRPDGYLYVCPFGNAGMATGGAGDVLAGLLGGLLATGLAVQDALVCGVCLHGLAGDMVVKKTGQRGMIAGDLLDGVQQVWSVWEQHLALANLHG